MVFIPGKPRFTAAMVRAQVLTQIGAFALPALLPGHMDRWSLSGTGAGWLTGNPAAAHVPAVPVLLALTAGTVHAPDPAPRGTGGQPTSETPSNAMPAARPAAPAARCSIAPWPAAATRRASNMVPSPIAACVSASAAR